MTHDCKHLNLELLNTPINSQVLVLVLNMNIDVAAVASINR